MFGDQLGKRLGRDPGRTQRADSLNPGVCNAGCRPSLVHPASVAPASVTGPGTHRRPRSFMIQANGTRNEALRAVLLVMAGSIGVQVSAALALGLFDSIGVLGTSALRMIIASIALCALLRPKLRGRSREEWIGIGVYGVSMAMMNVFLYLAIDRIPLGVATTIDFLGPCAVALAASRRVREAGLAVIALIGVVLIVGLGGEFDLLGYLFAVGAAVSFGLYTLLAAHVGKSEGGMSGVALSVAFSAVLTLPFAVPVVGSVQPAQWGILIVSALLGMALAFFVDTLAARLTSARVVGVLFAFDPVIGTLIGYFWLGQTLTPLAVCGIVLVVGAGAGIVWLAGARAAPQDPGELVTLPLSADSDPGKATP